MQAYRHATRRLRTVDFLELLDDETLEFHPELVPVDELLADTQTRFVLDAVIRAHRAELVATARRHLRSRRDDAEDLVQDICLAALEGELPLSPDPVKALDDLLRAVTERAAS